MVNEKSNLIIIMKSITRLILSLLIAVGAPVYLGAAEATSEAEVAPSPFEVVQIWSCEMSDGTSEQEVEAIAADWLKAVRQMPGGEAVKMRVFFPAVASGAGNVDFYFVLNAPSFSDWGKIWDAYQDDSAAAKSDDLNQGKVTCADSQLWEAHAIEAK
jgi:hypothetical protein